MQHEIASYYQVETACIHFPANNAIIRSFHYLLVLFHFSILDFHKISFEVFVLTKTSRIV